MSWKAHFSRALGAAPGRLHFAAHSHHLWPDVTYDAHLRAWQDAVRPTDLGPVQDRAFYLAGGYKYAMAGEGACWMHAPAGYGARPVDTGWFAMFDALTGPRDEVGATPYPAADDAARFRGATLDPTAIHRFVAVQEWAEREGLTFRTPHAGAVREQLREQGVMVDHRDDRLRFGFGVYQDSDDVNAAARALKAAWPG